MGREGENEKGREDNKKRGLDEEGKLPQPKKSKKSKKSKTKHPKTQSPSSPPPPASSTALNPPTTTSTLNPTSTTTTISAATAATSVPIPPLPSSKFELSENPSSSSAATATLKSTYLALCTEQFAADIDALRQAPDFRGQKSVDVLVRALEMGVELWGEEERKVLLGGVEGGRMI